MLLCAAGCTSDKPGTERTAEYDASPGTLSIVAGSEQESVINTIVKPWCASKGSTATRPGLPHLARTLADLTARADTEAMGYLSSAAR